MSNKLQFKGLTDDAVAESRRKYGKNVLPPPTVETFWQKLMENFEDPLIKILSVALVITVGLAFLGYAEWFEGVGIAVAVFLATFVSTYSEYKNESSFQELQAQASRVKSKVFRNGDISVLDVQEIVKGDFVLVQAGDRVPADGPLIAGSVAVDQAPLNGEPEPVRKNPPPEKELYSLEKVNVADPFMLFRGSIIEDGEGVLHVHDIGTATVYGKLMVDIEEAEQRPSPLTVKLTNLADSISYIGYVGAAFIFLSFLFKQFVMDQGYNWNATWNYLSQWQLALHDGVTALILSIIIIVVAVPEGLPMMIAIVLALNMQKLLDEKVLVRRLLGIETAGSLNLLFTDKTGTVTHGHLETHQFVTGENENFFFRGKEVNIPASLEKILHFTLKHSTQAYLDKSGRIVGGNSSDRAFLTIVDPEYLKKEEKGVGLVSQILFTSALKFSATELSVSSDIAKTLPPDFIRQGKVALVKGAPEYILPHCKNFFTTSGKSATIADPIALQEQVSALSNSGMRVIAISASFEPLKAIEKSMPKPQILIGFIGLRDEIRKETPIAIENCRKAGVQVVMITGDRKETAISVAREVGLLPRASSLQDSYSDRHLAKHAVLTSDALGKMTDDELLKIVPELCVIARALPTDKSRLVAVCEKLNKVVGMTGDGVNDAPALVRADVGFAMGSGTEMAKEAADIVIMDDNFNSIAKSILYGRTIFKSIRKFIVFQSTINIASTLIVFLGPFLGFDFPLTLIQLLWVNLVMDTLAALAFGGEPALPRYMKEKPVRRDDAIVSPYMWSAMIWCGLFVASASILFLTNPDVKKLFVRNGVPNQDVFLTAFFGFFIFISVMNAFNVRTPHVALFDSILLNPGFLIVLAIIFLVQIVFTYIGGSVLRTVPLETNEWLWIFGGSFIILPWDLTRKVLIAPCLPKRFVDSAGLEDAGGFKKQSATKKKTK